MEQEYANLWDCYCSEQMSEAQLQAHMLEDEAFSHYVSERAEAREQWMWQRNTYGNAVNTAKS